MHRATFLRLQDLAADALPQNNADFGSDRQIDAENAFFAEAEKELPDVFREGSKFSNWALKATADERIQEAMQIIEEA